jgi:uncharacterized protein
MSSTDRAPEPTMEEILASIRRIISDEEANAPEQVMNRPPPAPRQQRAQAVRPRGSDEPMPSQPPQPVQDEEILDLAQSVPLDDGQGAGAEEVFDEEPLDLSEDFGFAFEEEETDVETAMQEQGSALEAAIAALRGDQAKGMSASPPALDAAPPSVDNIEAEPAEEPEPESEESAESEDESLAEDAVSFAAMAGPLPHTPMARNGSASHEPEPFSPYSPSGKSMEETVKEMLRPMLRDWLDQNMTRVLEAALREELQETKDKPRHN